MAAQPLKIEYDGQVYEFDELDLDVDEAETIQKYAGRNLGDWSNGLDTCEVKSLVALWWLLRKRAGQNPGAITAKIAGFKPVKLFAGYAAAVKARAGELAAEEAEEIARQAAAPDPTRTPAASSPESAGTPTTPGATPATPSLPG